MKEVREIESGLYHIISEPGDSAQYYYLMLVSGDEYHFMPAFNDFRYPQILNYHSVDWLVKYLSMKGVQRERCDPHTLKECIRSMKEHRAGILMD